VNEFSRGGNGGGSASVYGVNGENYGDGGSASGNHHSRGGNGHKGIVVIRFLRSPENAP
jgi:hypothetical protein